jgi:hypothetical protein
MENFDRGRASQVEMLSQVNVCKAPFAQETVKLIVPDSLPFTFWHSDNRTYPASALAAYPAG